MRIVVFGDSISEGFWDYEKGGWVNMLKTDLWKKYGYEKMVMNYGVSSYTSDNIVKIFQSFFDGCSRREVGKEKESIVLIAVGINDCSIIKAIQKPRVEVDQFEENLKEIIQICKNDELVRKVIFITNINIDEKVINNSKDGENLFYNKNIELYNDVIKRLCKQESLQFIDTYGLMNNDDLEDGLHPNTLGHTKIFGEVRKYLDK